MKEITVDGKIYVPKDSVVTNGQGQHSGGSSMENISEQQMKGEASGSGSGSGDGSGSGSGSG